MARRKPDGGSKYIVWHARFHTRFPGQNYTFNTMDGEGSFIDCSTAPVGGSKTTSEMVNQTPALTAVVAKLKLSNPGFLYFQYGYEARALEPMQK